MSVLYLLTSPSPAIDGTDAVFQDVSALKEAVGGETLNLCPRRIPGAPFPPQLFGLHALAGLRQAEKRCKVSHLFFSVPYFFPVLRLLRNPIVYTVGASLSGRPKPSNIERLNRLKRIAVSNERDAGTLSSWGLSNVTVVPPSIDASSLTKGRLDLDEDVTLLMASAPWVEEQFDTKGVDAMLQAAARTSNMRLILLWRGFLLDELRVRIAALGIEERVEVVTERANVNDCLGRAHAAVLMAKRGDIVKAYPHSLIESLLAGKPVILTDVLPMADYVRRNDCGVVAEAVDATSFLAAVEGLRRRYGELARNARALEAREFSRTAMIEKYREIYGA